MVEKVEIHKLNFPVANIYNYNAMIFRSVDGGKTFCNYRRSAGLQEGNRKNPKIK